MYFLAGIRQGRYTLTERTKAIMEVKRLQNPELDFDQKAFDMVSAAVSQKNAERAQRLSVEDPLSCILIPTSPDCNRQQALSDISDDRSLADRLLDFSGFNTHNVSDELTDLLNPDYFFSEEMEIPSSVNMLSLDSSPCSNASPEVEIQLDLYDNVIDNLVGALNDMLPHSSQFTDEEIYAILKEGYVGIIKHMYNIQIELLITKNIVIVLKTYSVIFFAGQISLESSSFWSFECSIPR